MVGVLLTGCYTLQPVGSVTPDVGTKLALDVNDAGRVALGGLIGPEIGQIEGRLLSQENGDMMLAVSQVRFLRGGVQTWTGERLSIKRDFVGSTYERRFHKGRTILLTSVLVAGVVAIAASQDLLGFGNENSSNPRPIDPGTDFRPRFP